MRKLPQEGKNGLLVQLQPIPYHSALLLLGPRTPLHSPHDINQSQKNRGNFFSFLSACLPRCPGRWESIYEKPQSVWNASFRSGKKLSRNIPQKNLIFTYAEVNIKPVNTKDRDVTQSFFCEYWELHWDYQRSASTHWNSMNQSHLINTISSVIPSTMT